MGAAPDMANFKFPNPAADLSFFFSNSDTKGILRPILKTALDSIAETKLEDLNASSVEEAMAIIEGTARSMGIIVEG